MSTTKTMAEVLADHRLDTVLYLITEPEYRCICGKRSTNHSEHQAAALAAAGFGLVSDAKREAWDAGMMDQFEADLLGKPSPQNPYRDKLPLRRRGQQAGNKPTEPQTEVIYPPDPEWGTDPHGRFWYQDYDGESLHVWRDRDGELWIEKRGQGPVYVRAEDIPVIAAAVRGEG